MPGGAEVLVADFTALSGGAVHNRHDPHACNDPDLKREWSRKVEKDFEGYRGNAAVVVCPEAEWRAEVQRLRAAHPGHFFAPVFPR
jgi:hypothetical protein